MPGALGRPPLSWDGTEACDIGDEGEYRQVAFIASLHRAALSETRSSVRGIAVCRPDLWTLAYRQRQRILHTAVLPCACVHKASTGRPRLTRAVLRPSSGAQHGSRLGPVVVYVTGLADAAAGIK